MDIIKLGNFIKMLFLAACLCFTASVVSARQGSGGNAGGHGWKGGDAKQGYQVAKRGNRGAYRGGYRRGYRGGYRGARWNRGWNRGRGWRGGWYGAGLYGYPYYGYTGYYNCNRVRYCNRYGRCWIRRYCY